jgi:RNA polymerase sigma-70 factor (sigma-E family)
MTFEEFAAARLPALVRYAAVLTGDTEQARDIVQIVLARAFAKWARICRADRPDAYVHRMVTNEFLNSRRGRRLRLVELTREVVNGQRAPTVADPAEQIGERSELWQRLQLLPPRQRAVVVLRYYEGLSDLEIAGVLGCAAGTVRAHASRALAALRIELNTPDRRLGPQAEEETR